MAQVLLFHHAQGLTPGVVALADRWRAAGHTVHTPDLYEGRTFDDLDEGVDHARSTGFGTIVARGVAAADGLPGGLVLAGISLGAMPAHELAQRPGARGLLMLESCVAEQDGSWPEGLSAQVHGMDGDPSFALEGDLDVARALVAAHDTVELFTYPGDRHLFLDASLPSYDPAASALVTERVLAFLDLVG